jgi:TPR repeat protein
LLEDGRDPVRAQELLTHAAQKGNITAMIELAKLKTPDAPRWFKQVLESYPCDDDEILFIVKSYSKGENGAPLDLAKAMEWFGRLVGEGKQEPADLFTLAEILLETQDNEKESKQEKNKDKNKALSLLQQAHDSGHRPATLKLAGLYMNGTHVARDTARALSLYQTLAEKGDTEAMYTLGKAYLSGYATEVSPEKARKWLEKAAADGHKMAADMLGAMK